MDPGIYVGKAIRVYWEDDDEWYSGAVDNYHPDRGWHIQYYDGEDEWLTSMDKNVAFDDPIGDVKLSGTISKTAAPSGNASLDVTSELDIAINNRSEPPSKIERGRTNTYPSSINSSTRSLREMDSDSDNRDAKTEPSISSQSRRYVADPTEQSYLATNVDRSLTPVDTRNNAESYRRRDFKDESLNVINTTSVERSNLGSSYEAADSKVDVPFKGLLLVGTVYGASNLPTVDQNETDGKCFFRVLYVEGTGQSSMFRCKTPIFSSNATQDLQFPQWGENGKFLFEMIMPDNRGHGGGLVLQGQILVALYRIRGQGGHEFLGQVCFELTDLTQNGVKDSHQMGVEARSVSGEYPLIDRFDKAIGNYAEVKIRLQIAWRPESFLPEEIPVEKNSRQNTYGNIRPQSQGGNRSVYGREGGSSVAGTVRTFGASRVTNVKPSTVIPKGMSRGPPPIKMVSAQLRKQAEDKRRIDSQNKLMQNKLQAKGTRGRGDTTSNIYGGPTAKAEAKQRSISASGRKNVRGSELGSAESIASLVDVWTKMKKEVSEIEEENIFLKATLSKLKTHTKRHELTTDRLKKQAKTAPCDSKYDVTASRSNYAREQTLLPQEELDEEVSSIVDDELRELAMEHSTLQQLRRGLIDRVKVASMTFDGHVAAASTAQGEESMLRSRIALVAPFAVTRIASHVTSEQRTLRDTIDRLHKVQLDFLCADAAREHGFHYGALLDAVEEDRKLVVLLRRKKDESQSEAEKCQRDQDETKEKLSRLTEEKAVYRIRDKIADMRTILFQLRKTQCLEAIQEGSSTIEREVLRIGLKS